jgi:hypothetical protein
LKDIENEYLKYLNKLNFTNQIERNQVYSKKNNKRKFENKNSKFSKNLDIVIMRNPDPNEIYESQEEFSQFDLLDNLPSEEKRRKIAENNLFLKDVSKQVLESKVRCIGEKKQEIQSSHNLDFNTCNNTNLTNYVSVLKENSPPNEILISEQNFPSNNIGSLFYSKPLDIKKIRENKTENITQELISELDQYIEEDEKRNTFEELIDYLENMFPLVRRERIIKVIYDCNLDLDKIFYSLLDENKRVNQYLGFQAEEEGGECEVVIQGYLRPIETIEPIQPLGQNNINFLQFNQLDETHTNFNKLEI